MNSSIRFGSQTVLWAKYSSPSPSGEDLGWGLWNSKCSCLCLNDKSILRIDLQGGSYSGPGASAVCYTWASGGSKIEDKNVFKFYADKFALFFFEFFPRKRIRKQFNV